jgi:hypothetical protein
MVPSVVPRRGERWGCWLVIERRAHAFQAAMQHCANETVLMWGDIRLASLSAWEACRLELKADLLVTSRVFRSLSFWNYGAFLLNVDAGQF